MDDTHNFDFPETRHSEIRRNFSDFVKYFIKQIIDKVTLIGLTISSIFLFFALYSYEPSDASFNTMPTFVQTHNWMGKIGAYSADISIQLWGYGSYLWVVLLALWASAKYNNIRHKNLQPSNLQIKKSFFYGLLAVSAFSCFMTILIASTFLPTGSGGVFGMLITRMAQTGVVMLDIAQCSLSLTLALFLTKLAIGTNNSLRLLLYPLQLIASLFGFFFARQAKALPLTNEHIVVKKEVPTKAENSTHGEVLNIQKLIENEDEYDTSANIRANHAEELDEDEKTTGRNLSFMRDDNDEEELDHKSKLRLIHSIHEDVVIENDDTEEVEETYDYEEEDDDDDSYDEPIAEIDETDDEEYEVEAEYEEYEEEEIWEIQETNSTTIKNDFILPSLKLLQPADNDAEHISDEEIQQTAQQLEELLHSFKIKGKIHGAQSGPVITLYEFEPAAGVKTSQVVALADDVARAMSADSVRIAPVSGKSVIGIELPNPKPSTVALADILTSKSYKSHQGNLPIVLGQDIGGKAVVVDLAKMPHLLIAGTTGSGKSVGVNAMILSLLYRYSPQECRMIMIDPKMLELSIYNDIPHLLTPVVTEPKRAIVALKWAVREMERRYQLMSECHARNIITYNQRTADKADAESLPYIAIVVDEMADLMLVAGKEIEILLQRLAQMARAAGIHLITATQRPSVDVITGVIKANFPSRISYQVTSKFDSRTILGDGGAENLLGRGDMLFLPGGGKLQRIHGPFVADHEVESVCSHLRAQAPTDYVKGLTDEDKDSNDFTINKNGDDSLYERAVTLVLEEQKISTSFIQRKLQIGYNRAARLVEQMESEGIVSEANHAGKRQILIDNAA